jgi:sugar-specific transcriptional regulator TrmB
MAKEHEILKQIGLSENETVIYLTLLSNGSLSVYEIASKTGIYRPNVYDKLQTLLKKGLVSYVIKNSKKFFIAAEPEKIQEYLVEEEGRINRNKEKLRAILPKLSAMASLPKTPTKVEVFEGKEGLKVFLRDILRNAKEVLITGIDDARYNETLPTFMPGYFKELKGKQIRERVITADRPGIFQFKAATTNYRFLPEIEFNPTNTFIYANKVAIVSWDVPPTVIRIENEKLAKTYRHHFEHLWKVAKRRLSVRKN